MPRWIYSRPSEHCHPTELEVARKLNRLPDPWIVRWGYHYDDHGTSREGDFLVLAPDGGVLVLEVKTVLRLCASTGNWEGEHGGESPKIQLDAEWKGVLNHMEVACHGKPLPYVAKALCLPRESIASNLQSYQGIPRVELIDQRELANFTARWHALFQGRIHVSAVEARAAFLESFGRELREIRQFVKETDSIILRQLSLDYELLDMLGENPQLIVTGGVGSGKTWMALEQARRLASAGGQVLFLCYNLHLAALLKELAKKHPSSAGSLCVMSWEELAKEILEQAGIEWAPPGRDAAPGAREAYYTGEVPFMLSELLACGSIAPRFDALIVDEAQDHDTLFPESVGNDQPGGWWRIYHALLHGGAQAPMGIYFDPAQRPHFRPANFSADTLRDLMPGAARVKLLKTLRYTRQVLSFLKELESGATQALIEGLHPGDQLREGPEVQFQSANSGECSGVVRKIIQKWEAEGYCRPSEVLILSRNPNPLQKGGLDGVREMNGWRLAPAGKEADITVSSFNKAKGLDSLAVIMIDTLPFERLSETDQVGYWMAASRARQLLAIVHEPVV